MEVLPAAKPMFVRLARRLPIPPALAVSDSDALTPYMSHVVPGCAFWLLTVTDRFVRTSSPPMSTVPGAVQPLCAPRLANFVSPSESIMLTKCPSFPRRSSRSTYSMQAMPWPPNARFFQRSGSTANCCQRCWSVECSPFCGTMKFVSGHIPYSSSGSIECRSERQVLPAIGEHRELLPAVLVRRVFAVLRHDEVRVRAHPVFEQRIDRVQI